jgi:hypothetical protein
MIAVEGVNPSALEALQFEQIVLKIYIDVLRENLAGIESAINILSESQSIQMRIFGQKVMNTLGARRPPLNRIILGVLNESPQGLSLSEIGCVARETSFQIKLNSAAVVLSRMKKTGAVVHQDGRYRLPASRPTRGGRGFA